MLNSPQHFLSGLASNYQQGYTPQATQQIPYSTASGYHHTILGAAGRFDSAAAMMQQGGAGFGMVARATLMPTPASQHTGVNGAGGHHPPPHPHHPVSLGLEVRDLFTTLQILETDHR